MWVDGRPFLTKWYGDAVSPAEILYELDGPAIFTSHAGPATFLCFKVAEENEGDVFLVAPVEDEELVALRSGNLSMRGAMSHREAWLAEINFDFEVIRYQEQSYQEYGKLLPDKGVALYSSFGEAADTLEQSEAFLSFKFESGLMSALSMPLSVLKGRLDAVSDVVRGALMPERLSYGRKGRFFDPEVFPLRFDSLLIAIKEPQFDEQGLLSSKETAGFTPESLVSESEDLGARFVEELEETANLARGNGLTKAEANLHFELLDRIAGIVPTTKNELTRLQVGFRTKAGVKLVSIDKRTGDNIVAARQSIQAPIRRIKGTIIELNDDAKTFIVKDAAGRQTTVNPLAEKYQEMIDRDLMKIGQRLLVTGRLWERIRRDYIILTQSAEPLA